MRPFRPGEAAYVGPGITYLRTPLVLDPTELTGVDIAILGAPFDEGVTNRPGTRFGPRAIRMADHSGVGGRTHMEVGIDPKEALTIVDYGDIEVTPSDLLASHELLRSTVLGILRAGATPVVLGGDHSLSAPMMMALAEQYGPDGFAVIHFDTHADTGFDGESTPYNHGTPFYRGVNEGFMRGDHIFQIGLRGTWPNPVEFDWMREVGFRWRTMAEVMDLGWMRWWPRRWTTHDPKRTTGLPDCRYRCARSGVCSRHWHPGAGWTDDARATQGNPDHRQLDRYLCDGYGRGFATV